MAMGRTRAGRLKKGYRLLKGGRVVKAKAKGARRSPKKRRRPAAKAPRPVAPRAARRKPRRARKPAGTRIRPALYKSRRGIRAGRKSKTFRRKSTVIRRNPTFNLKRVMSPNYWLAGLKDAGMMLLGVGAQNALKRHVTEPLAAQIAPNAASSVWISRLLSVVNAALVGELARVMMPGKANIGKLVFAGALFQTVKDVVVDVAPAQVAGYLGAYGWPDAPGMHGYATTESPFLTSGRSNLAGYFALGDQVPAYF